MQPVAFAYNGYTDKFGIPRQSGRVEAVETRIVFTAPFRSPDAIRGIEQWSHLWLIWSPTCRDECIASSPMSDNEQQGSRSLTVRPPRLGGNTRLGVFATRSPFRPNGLCLSSVKLLRVEQTENEGHVLIVSGADLMNGTPIYDIKPYLPYTDCHPDATNGFAEDHKNDALQVLWSPEAESTLNTLLVETPYIASLSENLPNSLPAYGVDTPFKRVSLKGKAVETLVPCVSTTENESYKNQQVETPSVQLPASARVFPEQIQQQLTDILKEDPRPGYHDNPEKIYGLTFSGFNLHFRVENNILTVLDIAPTT